MLQRLLPHYARSDQLAISYQKWHLRAATWLYRLAAIAVAVAVLQAVFLPDATSLILLEILELVVAFSWLRLSVCGCWHDKWLHYRHLAERFRILLFKKLLNTTGEVDNEGANQLLPFYPGPGGWVVVAFDEVAHSIPSPSVVAAELTAVRRFLVAGWISDQANYHASNADEKHKAAQRSHKITGLMLVVTLVAACLHWLKVAEDPLIENLVICVAIILPAFASAQHAIAGIHDYERIAARSARMADILKGLDRSISEASTEKTLRSEIGRAEHIMATENHEWCVSLSFRRLSLPV